MNQLRPNYILAGVMIAVMVLGIPLSTAANNEPRRVIIGFKDTPGAEHRQLIESMGGRVLHQYNIIKAIAAEMPNHAVTALALSGKVTYVETEQHRAMEDHIVIGSLWTGTPEILPWGVERVQADDVWDSTPKDLAIDSMSVPAGQGVKVAVLDSGIQLGHEDLTPISPLSFDLLGMDADVSDIPGPVTGHGTATSGIVAARDNEVGVIGVAPRATIIMYRVCDSALNSCPDTAIIAALERAVTDGADVVSMSFGGIGFSIPFKQAIHAAFQAGIVLVASAGNTPIVVAGARHYPSGFPEVIAVGATDRNNNLATFSTFGGHQELVAPGVATPTTALNGQGRDNSLAQNSPDSHSIPSNPMAFSGLGTLTKKIVFAGLGRALDFAAVDCTNKIALIARGTITFRAKIENAAADGCLGAIIHNNVAGNFFGTAQVPQAIPAVSISLANGMHLRTHLLSGDVEVTLSVVSLNYNTFSGTSASAPYVSGVAALVLSANPALTNREVRKILRGTAVDLGDPGRDILFGWGLVNALGAVQCATGVITCELP